MFKTTTISESEKIMKKIKEFSKKYLIGFTLGLITSGIVVVCAATYFPSNQTTYNNGTTGMKATNVQTAIDELYNTCFPKAGEQIIENAGLEKDPYECRYFFTGATPNNYITFNNETWRIVSKIMRDADISTSDSIEWDSSNSNNWTRPASLNTYLNGTYLNGLTSTVQSQIVAKDWSIGPVTQNNNDLADQINDENSKKWNGKVALPTLSEYIRSNSNQRSCGTFSENNSHYNSCKNSTWMYNSNDYWWTLSPNVVFSNYLFMLRPSGDIVNGFANGKNTMVRLAVYLSSDIQITGGNGSSSNPYILSET